MKEIWSEIISTEPTMWMRYVDVVNKKSLWNDIRREDSFNFGWKNYNPKSD